ncbi:hypothetical protein QT397_14285 [Microbulbifer sp. MKSA007]|nr:hypothetical protein QT397_14285 [Microbulbifer sp. MKSA007]
MELLTIISTDSQKIAVGAVGLEWAQVDPNPLVVWMMGLINIRLEVVTSPGVAAAKPVVLFLY